MGLAVLITGASRGIGLALTTEYLKRGADVIATCRAPGSAAALHALARVHGGRLAILHMDVADPRSVIACRAEAGRHTDRLDVLISNAGVLHRAARLDEIESGDLLDSFRVNAIGPMLVARAFADLLVAGAPSRLVHITMPTPAVARLKRRDAQPYVASRFALNALTKMLSMELIERGVVTVGLYPGYLRTDMNGNAAEAAPPESAIPNLVATIEGLQREHNGLMLMPDGSAYEG